VVRTTIEAARRKQRCGVAGVGSTSTADAVAQARAYQRLAPDGILAIWKRTSRSPIADRLFESYLRAIAGRRRFTS